MTGDPTVTDSSLVDRSFPVILAGPSGAGKTTVRDRLLESTDGERFLFSVSMTTRAAREGERGGLDYEFVTREAFDKLVSADEMLEHATVHGELYGTPLANLERARRTGRHLLLDIDVQGARQVRAVVPEVLSLFILPPSAEEMLRRLRGRASETEEQLRRRYLSAIAELDAVGEFDYAIVNETRDDAVARVLAIVDAERRSLSRLGDRAIAFAHDLRDEIEKHMR